MRANDGVGRRLAKREVVNGQTNAVQYLWDGWTVLAALDGEGRLVEYYTRGLGIAGDIGSLVAETRFTHGATVATYYYHNNHRGDVTAVREGTNTLTAVDYRTFGAIRSTTGPFTPRFGFSSKERDRASGLVYFGYRYYAAEYGRWVSADPLDHTLQSRELINKYSYVMNNSINRVDVVGLQTDYKISDGTTITNCLWNMPDDTLCTFPDWGSELGPMWQAWADAAGNLSPNPAAPIIIIKPPAKKPPKPLTYYASQVMDCVASSLKSALEKLFGDNHAQ